MRREMGEIVGKTEAMAETSDGINAGQRHGVRRGRVVAAAGPSDAPQRLVLRPRDPHPAGRHGTAAGASEPRVPGRGRRPAAARPRQADGHVGRGQHRHQQTAVEATQTGFST